MSFFKFFSALIFLAAFGLSLPSGAGAKTEKFELSELTKVFKDLQKPVLVSMQVKKKISSEFMMRPKESEGELYFSKGKIRLSIEKPDPSLLILNGDDIWLEEKQPEEFGGTIQVSHYKSSKAEKASALLALLFGKSEIWNEFELSDKKVRDTTTSFTLNPKDKSRLNITELRVALDEGQPHRLKAVSFSDELNNLTEYEFSKIKTQKSAKSKLFKYTPPKGAEVTRF